MRCFSGLAGLLTGTGLIAMGATAAVGCGDDFSGCEASRTCPSGGTAGMTGGSRSGGTAGADDDASGAPGGGKGGSPNANGGGSAKGGSSSGASGGQGSKGGSSSNGTSAGEGGVNPPNGSGGETTGGTVGESGASQGGAGGEAGGDSSTPANDAPTIVSTTPGYKEKGVRDDVEISITFSEPMNTASVEQAYVSEELPLGDKVQLTWMDNDTRLVITHSEPLEYASVASIDEAPKEYRVTIGGTATDAAGTALGEDFKLPFYTLRDVTQDLRSRGAYELAHPNDSNDDTSTKKCDLRGWNYPVSAGDSDTDVTLAFAMSFDVYALADGIVEWRSATVHGPFATSALNPFVATRLGELWGYYPLVALQDLTWSSPTSFVGTAAQFASQESFTLNVVDDLADYYESPPNYTFAVLFQFQYETNSDGLEQSLTADCAETWLHVEYLVP